ncbi:MAG TPA: polysaccharide deacetylase family protein, partial [Elusimicrobiota bacterium]|nr:polysaccharide deacetylase family protein [Elusimicrobiota bacterium]
MNPTALGVCAATAAGVSARWNWWRPAARGLPVLMYHKVGTPPRGSKLGALWVETEEFEWQMRYLLRRGFTPMLFGELAACDEGRAPWPEKPALVTFDDGYANNCEEAFPVLSALGVKANVFLVVETVGSHNAWHDPATEPWLRMLDWGQVERMRDSGLVDFGSHTMRHRNLASLPLEDVRWEARESKKRLEERLGREVAAFAYPYGAGAYDAGVRAAVRAAGYRYDFGIRQG